MSNDKTLTRDKLLRVIIRNIEYNSSTVQRSREYLAHENIDPDEVLAKGLEKIKQLTGKLKQDIITKDGPSVGLMAQGSTTKRTWTHPSVLRLIKESGGDDPIEIIRTRARNLVLTAFELGWDGPPYNPIQLASYLGIDVVPNDSVVDARIVPQKKSFQIQYNPFQRPTRINFSVSHEIAHTLFPDCAEAVRNREMHPMENRQLEQLCNAAAAEIQLPYAVFSHDANSASPSIEGLIDLATKYKASLESVFIRYAEVIDKPCAILIGIFQNESSIIIDYYKSSKKFPVNLPDYYEIPKSSKAYECTSPGWTSREQADWEVFDGAVYNIFTVGISSYRKDKKSRVGILVLPTETYDLSPDKGKVILEIGDATKPRGKGRKIIAQVVNTGAALGRGFGYSLAKNYPVVKTELQKWKQNKEEFQLGKTNLVQIDKDLYVFQMLAQKGIIPKGNETLLKYLELRKCLIELREAAIELGCSIHMPAIGAGNAGGDWNIIVGMIHDELVNYGLKVNIYLFQGKPYNPKEKTTLTLFKEDSAWETEK